MYQMFLLWSTILRFLWLELTEILLFALGWEDPNYAEQYLA